MGDNLLIKLLSVAAWHSWPARRRSSA